MMITGKAARPEPHLKNIQPAILTVGGFFDQEDPYGPLKTHASIEKGGYKDRIH
jgi:hypothetical protein